MEGRGWRGRGVAEELEGREREDEERRKKGKNKEWKEQSKGRWGEEWQENEKVGRG